MKAEHTVFAFLSEGEGGGEGGGRFIKSETDNRRPKIGSGEAVVVPIMS